MNTKLLACQIGSCREDVGLLVVAEAISAEAEAPIVSELESDMVRMACSCAYIPVTPWCCLLVEAISSLHDDVDHEPMHASRN